MIKNQGCIKEDAAEKERTEPRIPVRRERGFSYDEIIGKNIYRKGAMKNHGNKKHPAKQPSPGLLHVGGVKK